MTKGKLIVIDGIDGSGKATQVKLLEAKLKKLKVKVKTIDFPRYYENFFGKLIGEYLSGAYGDFIQTDPRVASVLYAADRFESGQQIKKWLEDGCLVITDRYVSANQIHQGGKINKISERKKFQLWLEQMEYGVFKIPRPNLVIYLDVPLAVSQKWLEQKVAKAKKKYLNGRRDVAEDNLLHLKNSRASALSLVQENKNWRLVKCCKGLVCLSPEGVHEVVLKIVKKELKLD